MDKGIRPFANAKFLELLPTRENTRLGNRNFRASVITATMESFGIGMASAATAYNNAFISARKQSETNEELKKSLEGLGRPEDKKGGRKKKAAPAEAAPAAETPAADGAVGDVLASNILGSGDTDEDDDTPDEPQAQAAPKVTVIQKNGKAGPWEFDTMEQALAHIEANSGPFKPKMAISE